MRGRIVVVGATVLAATALSVGPVHARSPEPRAFGPGRWEGAFGGSGDVVANFFAGSGSESARWSGSGDFRLFVAPSGSVTGDWQFFFHAAGSGDSAVLGPYGVTADGAPTGPAAGSPSAVCLKSNAFGVAGAVDLVHPPAGFPAHHAVTLSMPEASCSPEYGTLEVTGGDGCSVQGHWAMRTGQTSGRAAEVSWVLDNDFFAYPIREGTAVPELRSDIRDLLEGVSELEGHPLDAAATDRLVAFAASAEQLQSRIDSQLGVDRGCRTHGATLARFCTVLGGVVGRIADAMVVHPSGVANDDVLQIVDVAYRTGAIGTGRCNRGVQTSRREAGLRALVRARLGDAIGGDDRDFVRRIGVFGYQHGWDEVADAARRYLARNPE